MSGTGNIQSFRHSETPPGSDISADYGVRESMSTNSGTSGMRNTISNPTSNVTANANATNPSINSINFTINPAAQDFALATPAPTTSTRKRFITSCVTCRRRKVRCDRQKPTCVRCSVSGHSCSYITEYPDHEDHPPMSSFAHGHHEQQIGRHTMSPSSSESPPAFTSGHEVTSHGHQPSLTSHTRKRDRSPTQHPSSLLQRLRRLEGIVAQLGSQTNSELLSLASQQELLNTSSTGSNASRPLRTARTTPADLPLSSESSPQSAIDSAEPLVEHSPGSGLNPGKLLNEGGRTRYVSSLCWELITDEIQDLSLRVQDSIPTPSQQGPTAPAAMNQQTCQGTTCNSGLGSSNSVPCPAIGNPILSSSSLVFSPGLCTKQFTLPPRAEFDYLYTIFTQRVDPILRLQHIPSLNTAVEYYFTSLNTHETTSPSDQQPPRAWQIYKGNTIASFEALLFSILYGTINALSDEELFVNFNAGKITHGSQFDPHLFSSNPRGLSNELKSSLLRYYRIATEQALVRTQFLEKSDIVAVMAFTTLLICISQEADIPIVYPLTGLLIRVAQMLGLHRDPCLLFPTPQRSSQSITDRQIPTKGSISPVETELRRRLWHHICHLDLRASERHGPDPDKLLDENMWPDGPATSFPRCIDDEDLSDDIFSEDNHCLPSDPSFHDPGRFTRVTSLLVRFHASLCFRRLQTVTVPPFSGIDAKTRNILEEEIREKAKAHIESMVSQNNKLLKYCLDGEGEGDIPVLKRLTAGLVKVVELKVRILYYYKFEKGKESSPEEQLLSRERALHKALELIQTFHNTCSDPQVYPYHWHFDAHIPFHPLFHILSELCTPTFQQEKYRELRNKARTLLHAMAWISDPNRQDASSPFGGGLPRSTYRGKEWGLVRRLLRLVDNGSNPTIQLPPIQKSGGLKTSIDVNRPMATIDTMAGVPFENTLFGPEVNTQFTQDPMDAEQSFSNRIILPEQPELNWVNDTGFGLDQYDWNEMSRLMYMDLNFM